MIIAISCSSINAKTFQEEAAFKQVSAKVYAHEYIDAWLLVNHYTEDYLGDPEFDFFYGLIALNIGENERAVFAFERVVINKPSWLDAQLYLARSYLKMKSYHSTIEVSNRLLAQQSLPENLKLEVNQLKEIAVHNLEKQSFYINQVLSASSGFDSNVNAGTREDNIYFPFLKETITLSDNSTESSDAYLSLNYQLNGRHVFSQTSKLRFFAKGQSHTFLSKSEFNRLSLSGNVEYQKDFTHFSSSVGVQIAPLWFDKEFYRNQFGTKLGLNKKFNEHFLLSGDIYLGQTSNHSDKNLSTDDGSLALAIQYFNGSWRHMFSTSYLAELTNNDAYKHNSRKTSAISYSTLWLINKLWLVNAQLGYQHQDYQAEHPFFFEIRQDKMLLMGLSLKYQQSKSWSYNLSTNFQDKTSNLPLFSYQRFDVFLSTSMNF